jgi:hypothetical protein
MMVERGDHQVFDEPFSARYYLSPERRSDRYTEDLPAGDTESIVASLREAARAGPVFVKEMAYQASGLLDADLLGSFVNTFLVREPGAAVASFARKWPDLTEEEAGYDRLGEAFRIATRVRGEPPPVMESDELAADPEGMVTSWCDAVGLPFRAEALTWEPGMIEQWTRWREWYEGVARSTGFQPPESGPPPTLEDPRLAAIVQRARPVYDELVAHRLRPAP